MGLNGAQRTILLASFVATSAWAAPEDQCYRIYSRLTGVSPKAQDIKTCTDLMAQGKVDEAVLAMTNHEFFYSETLKSIFSAWTNKDRKVLIPLNDFSATAIGLARDNVDFRTILTGDVIYTCEGVAGVPAYSNQNNNHYKTCEINANLKTALVAKKQSDLNPMLKNKTNVPAGVFTTRAFAESFYMDGTNRVAVKETLASFLCEDIPAFHDTAIPDYRVRQDVERNPGGSAKSYVNECKGCHAGMDGLAGAFAYMDFDKTTAQLIYADDKPQKKYLRNSLTFIDGYRTTDDGWKNLWTTGPNARVGWNFSEGQKHEGHGPRSLGAMLANSDQFSRCMAKYATEKVCMDDLELKSARLGALAKEFKDSGYNLRVLFAKTALSCAGE